MTEAINEVIEDVISDNSEIDTDSITQEPDEKTRLFDKFKVDLDSFDEEALLKTLKRIEKAESLTIEQKKRLKELEKSGSTEKKFLTEQDLEKRDFLKENPELKDFQKEFNSYLEKGLSFSEAKALVLAKDTAKESRETLNSVGLSYNSQNENTIKSSYTKTELAELPDSQYNKVIGMIKSGQVKLR